MYQFKDPSGPTRLATVAMWCYLAADVVYLLSRHIDAPKPLGDSFFDAAEALYLFILAVTIVLVGRWTYRTNANAHSFGSGMTIRPGWAVGWHFVPLANLVMPYLAMKEAWQKSHEAAGLHRRAETPLLPWWWGLWLGSEFAGFLAAKVAEDPSTSGAALFADIFVSALTVALCIVLVRLMRRLEHAQLLAAQGGAFA